MSASIEVRGCAPPPKRNHLDVFKITAVEPITLVSLSRAPWGQTIHWYNGRSHECKGEHRHCFGCKEGWPFRWVAYLHVGWPSTQNQGFLEITKSAWEMLLVQAHTGQDLRGMLFRMGRTKGGKKGRYVVQVLERRLDDAELFKELDPYPTLLFLWNCKKSARSVA